MGTFDREPLDSRLRCARLGLIGWEVSLGSSRVGTFGLAIALRSSWTYRLGTFAWEPLDSQLRCARLGLIGWEVSLGNFRLGAFGLAIALRSSWTYRLGGFAWELSLGHLWTRNCAALVLDL